MKNLIIAVILTAITVGGYAQNHSKKTTTIEISGKVVDKDTKQPLEYATIVLKPLKGTITGGITDENGNFNITILKGTYDISVEFISFKTKKLPTKTISTSTNLGTITLETSTETLEEVEIIAEKSTVDIRLDKRIYNVGKDMTVKGGTANDVLNNVPSVMVDVEGNVSLRGNENVRILINGKPSGLVGISGTDALRQLPADAIEKVEVITSPSARYEAEGTAGILNIVLRKGKALGFNGSISASVGTPELYSTAVNANVRSKKVNYFANVGYNKRLGPGNSKNATTYLDKNKNPISYRNEKRNYDRARNGIYVNGGAEFFLSNKSSLTTSALYRNYDRKTTAKNLISAFDKTKKLTSKKNRIQTDNENDQTLEFSVNYTQKFNTEGHLLTVDAQYSNSKENEKANIIEKHSFPTKSTITPERNNTNEKSKNYLIKADYVLPINENTQFEFGFKADFNNLTSNYLVEDYDTHTKTFKKNTNLSNTLNFKQDIMAVYSQFGKKINHFSYLLGLRLESTNRNIKLENNNSNKKFTELFPTINLGYEFNENESVTLGYSKRLRRPWHWFLNPFESRVSETYIFKGNVNLDPTYTNSFDLGYLKKWNKLTLNSSIYYRHTTNNFEMISQEEKREINGILQTIILRTPINLSSEDRYGLEFTANYNPSRKVRLSSSFNFFEYKTNGNHSYTNTEGKKITTNYNTKDKSWFARLTSRIQLPAKIDWQTTAMYRGPKNTSQSKREGSFTANLAFSKDILKDKGTISLNVSDLLNTRKRKSKDYTNFTISEGEFQWSERQITASFVYRFNQNKKRKASRMDRDDDNQQMF